MQNKNNRIMSTMLSKDGRGAGKGDILSQNLSDSKLTWGLRNCITRRKEDLDARF